MLQQRWSTKLLGYDYDVKYRRGIENRAADALSRLYEEKWQFNVIILVKPQWLQELIASYGNDPVAGELKQQLTADPKCKLHYSLINGVLRYKNKLYVDNNEATKAKILDLLHSSSEGGHSGYLGTYQKAKSLFYWKGMKAEAKAIVESCDICQRNKSEHTQPAGLLQPLLIPEQAW